ncbi:MAG TPA: hypothetical protein VH561_16145 [Micromonosporaceae bacterium]
MRRRSPVTSVLIGLLAVLLTASVAAFVLVVAADRSQPAAGHVSAISTTSEPTPTATGSPTPPPTLAPLALHGDNPVSVSASWWGWTLLDRRTGQMWGSANDTQVNRSASMVKAWLAAFYLRLHPNPSQSWLDTLTIMIRDSDNDAADATHNALGGNTPVTSGMQTICGVSGVKITPGHGWAWTQIAPQQTARLGACIASGKVDTPKWTQWLLNEMRHVRGVGNFGIRLAFPAAQQSSIAIKNGWVDTDGVWYINCLAIGDTWVLAVETRSSSFTTGSKACASVTTQLLKPAPSA